jgi:DNA-binding FadR family transcriptional regulator
VTDFQVPTRGQRGSAGAWRPARFASVVIGELARRIISGELGTGDVLPTEPALCDEFGFSRTVIREAVKTLEERGLVRVEQGRGTTVQPRSSWNLLDPLVVQIALEYDDDLSLLDGLVTVRRVLEQEMAKAAAVRIGDDDLARLEACMAAMEGRFDDYGRFREADQEFHSVVMAASGNEAGLTIVRTIHRHTGGTPAMIAEAGSSRELLEQTVREHRQIYDALAARDADRASDLIAAHIDASWVARKRVAKT